MTTDTSPQPISALRARMIEDMTVHGFNERTRGHYVRHVRAFAAFIGRSPDAATAEDVRLFQLHQTRSGVQPPSINGAVSRPSPMSANRLPTPRFITPTISAGLSRC